MRIKVLFSCSIFLISSIAWSSKFSEECAKKFSAYKEACTETLDSCDKIESCENILEPCSKNIQNSNECKEFNSCMFESTPLYFRQVCLYKWNGNSCQNQNKLGRDDVATSCPGFETDEPTQCTGQIDQFKLTYKVCRIKELDYLRSCSMAGDIDRGDVLKDFCGIDFDY